MGNLLTKLTLWIAKGLFSAIDDVYRLFYGLASTRLFREADIKAVSDRLYIFVSVVILFAFAIKLIEAIVNPDLLTDAKKGVTGVLKRTIIGLVLIVAIPNIFSLAYYFQREILGTALVEKIVLGYTEKGADVNNAGGILTSSIIRGFVYPVDSSGHPLTEYVVCEGKTDCNYADELINNHNAIYEEYVSLIGGNPDYDKLPEISFEKTWEDTEQSYYYVSRLMLLITGIYILYQVITMSFDAALRLVNLGILEMISPIIVVSYIGGGSDYLSKWAKMTTEKFVGIFIRIAALAFMIAGLDLMSKSEIFNSQSTTFLFKLLVIIGLLRLVKDLPNLVSKLFGVDIKDAGGIKGRLGEMAGIGGLAQKAWAGMGGIAKGAAKTAGLAAAGGIASGAKAIDKKAFNGRIGDTARKISDSKVGRFTKIAAAGVKSGGKNTTKALKDAREKYWSPEIAAAEAQEKQRKSNKYNTMLEKASGSSISLNKSADGKISINFDGTAKANLGNIENVNKQMIDGTNLSDVNKEILNKYNKSKSDYSNKQYESNNRSELTSYLESLKSSATGAGQTEVLNSLIDDINNGKISNATDLGDRMRDQLDFADRSVTSGLMDNLISATSDEKMRNDILQAKALWDSGSLSATDLKDYMRTLAPVGSDMYGVISDFNAAVDKTSNDVTAQFAKKAESIASKDGAIGGLTTTEMNESLQKAQTDLEKAKKAVEERKEKEIGQEKEFFESTFSAVDKLIDAEAKEKRIQDAKKS